MEKGLEITFKLLRSTSQLQSLPSSSFSIPFQSLRITPVSVVTFQKKAHFSTLSSVPFRSNHSATTISVSRNSQNRRNDLLNLSSSPLPLRASNLIIFQKNTFSTSTDSNPTTPPSTSSSFSVLPRGSKFMDYARKYGAAFVLTEVFISTLCTACLYVAIRQGVDVESLLSSVQDYWHGPHVHDATEREITQWTAAGGTFALAFATNKLLIPLRAPLALALTPKVAKYFHLKNAFSSVFPSPSSSSTSSTSTSTSPASSSAPPSTSKPTTTSTSKE
jgi:hypothetical protein